MSASELGLELSDTPIPGLDKALGDGLTEHLNEVKPGLAWERKELHIAYYAPEGSDDSAGKWLTDSNGKRTDEKRKMLAGLSGYTITGLVFIRLLWTDPSLRGQGIGDALMRKAEDAGIERGCVSMFVDTMSFQAPSFYRRLGYKEIYSIERCWGLDIQRIYFQKDLQIQANSY